MILPVGFIYDFMVSYKGNCSVTNRSPNPGEKGYGSNKPSTINL